MSVTLGLDIGGTSVKLAAKDGAIINTIKDEQRTIANREECKALSAQHNKAGKPMRAAHKEGASSGEQN